MNGATTSGYCLAYGLITMHVRTEAGERTLPAALYETAMGEEALRRAGPRVRRIARWDRAGWETWWELLARVAEGRPGVVALPPLEDGGEVPTSFPAVYRLPPSVAVRAASDRVEGIALYLGAFAWEVAAFGPAGMDGPVTRAPGLEPLYRTIIADYFRRERRPLLPVQVPALLPEGEPPDVTGLLEGIAPLLGDDAVVLGGEETVVLAAVARALEGRGHEVAVVNPLDGLERLVVAVEPFREAEAPGG